MGFFSEYNDIINKVIELLYNDQSLMRYLMYDSDNPLENNTEQPDIVGSSVVFDRLLPFPKSTNGVNKKGSFINVYMGSAQPQRTNSKYRDDTIHIDIICHLDIWKIINGNIRPYSMLNLIDKKFNNEFIENVSSLQSIYLLASSYRQFSEDFYGYTITYRVSNNSNIRCQNG